MSEPNPGWRVAIVGMGGVFPGCADLAGFHRLVLEGRSAAAAPPPGRWALDPAEAVNVAGGPDTVRSGRACFVTTEPGVRAGGLDARRLEALDPLHRLALAAGQQAWDSAKTRGVDPARAGVVLGQIALPTQSLSALSDEVLEGALADGLRRAAALRGLNALPASLPGPPGPRAEGVNRYVTGLPAGVLAQSLGLGGASWTLDAACASSLYAVKFACDELAADRADLMLAGGLSRPDSLYTQMGFTQLRALSPSGVCAPFDAGADGLVVGEGCGVVALKRLEDALRDGDRVLAVIRGAGLSNDLGGSLMQPDSEGQLRAMRQAYRLAGWRPGEVDLIECHGTGTPVGDAVELRSLASLLRAGGVDGPVVLSSVKSNIGHLLTGAGAAALIKTLLAMGEGMLPPTANFRAPCEALREAGGALRVLRTGEEWAAREGRPRRAAVSGFGFGGINAHLLLEAWDGRATPQPRRAKSTPKLKEATDSPSRVEVAVVGWAARVGDAESRDALARLWFEAGSREGESAGLGETGGRRASEVRVRVGRFPVPPQELASCSAQQLMMLNAAGDAMDDAGLQIEPWARERTGVYIGLGQDFAAAGFHFRWTMGERARRWSGALGLTGSEGVAAWAASLRDACQPALTADRTMGNLGGIVASRVARAVRAGGPSFAIGQEEGSGLRALEQACRALRSGEIDVAVVGAVDMASDFRHHAASGREAGAGGRAGLSDGAAALVLMRVDDARERGCRVLARVAGFGAARGTLGWAKGPARDGPTASAAEAAGERALKDAQLPACAVGLIEGLSSFTEAGEGGLWPRAGAIEARIGDCGAAGGLLAVARAVWALEESVLPAVEAGDGPSMAAAAPAAPVAWLRDRVDGPRAALVAVPSVTGDVAAVVLCEAGGAGDAQPGAGEKFEGQVLRHSRLRARLLPRTPALFVVRAPDGERLARSLRALADRAGGEPGEAGFAGLACEGVGSAMPTGTGAITGPAGGVSAAVLARDPMELAQGVARAIDAVEQRRAISGPMAWHSPKPLAAQGRLALVYTGAGHDSPGMGRELALAFPEALAAQDRANERLASQFARRRFWDRAGEVSHADAIFGQVWLGCLAQDALRSVGVCAEAAIGYSLGETTSLFAHGVWGPGQRDEMLRRLDRSTLFRSDLAGRCDAARAHWRLPAERPVEWLVGVLARPAAQVDELLARWAAAGEFAAGPRAYRLIRNSPGECVIGGSAAWVRRVGRELGAGLVEVRGVTAVHCEAAVPVAAAYRELHRLETQEIAGVSFYSGGAGGAYRPTRDAAAEAILNQAIGPFDFGALIEAAYADGVRLFVEAGPGGSCTRMIVQTLGERGHLAVAALQHPEGELAGLARACAALAGEGVAVDAAALNRATGWGARAEAAVGDSTNAVASVAVSPARGVFDPQTLPLPEVRRRAQGGEDFSKVRAPEQAQPSVGVAAVAQPVASGLRAASGALPAWLRGIEEVMEVEARTQAAFLSWSAGAQATMAVALRWRAAAAAAAGGGVIGRESWSESTDESGVGGGPVKPFMDYGACLRFATGRIADVLGEGFAAVDAFPTRVRLPDEPLMLAHRVVEVEGPMAALRDPDCRPESVGGRCVTEHDVAGDAWYLDHGRVPTCIAVEAGQADLFLSGYLGIDFRTRGLAVYRLLDAAVTFHGPLPTVGDTLRYDIRILEFFRQGETHLFRFEFDATVGGRRFLTMRDGCAGFFTQRELDEGKGVVLTAMDRRRQLGRCEEGFRWPAPQPRGVASLDDAAVEALRRGELGALGPEFASLRLRRSAGLPGGRMRLVHRIVALEAMGGRHGLGRVVGEADVRPDDWFLTCHFVDDRVMPGTLMYECCLHTLRVFLIRMGWVGEVDAFVAEPVPGQTGQLRCRGQVLEGTKRVRYEVEIKEAGYRVFEDLPGGLATPYVIADAMMEADGKPIVQMRGMSLRLSGLSREGVESLWRASDTGRDPSGGAAQGGVSGSSSLVKPGGIEGRAEAPRGPVGAPARPNPKRDVRDRGYDLRPALYDYQHIHAYADGDPSDGFGERYRPFDAGRVLARLPRPPFQLMDRVVEIRGGKPWEMRAGCEVVAQYDVPPADHPEGWYFRANRQPLMPFAVLLEVALQPCGWLAAFVGSALTSEVDLSFRNLGGRATALASVDEHAGTLTTRVKLTGVSSSGGMIIQHYDLHTAATRSDGSAREVYRGTTYFGFFSKAALANQVGLRDAALYESPADERARAQAFELPDAAPMPDDRWRMIERVDHFDPRGGPHGLGFIEGSTRVDPERWFFQAHFKQDPVWPGSLGLESFLQLLKVVAWARWGGAGDWLGLSAGDGGAVFESVATGHPHAWVYRGQVLPSDQRVRVQAVVKGVDDGERRLTADGFLIVDGRVIYQMLDFTTRLRA